MGSRRLTLLTKRKGYHTGASADALPPQEPEGRRVGEMGREVGDNPLPILGLALLHKLVLAFKCHSFLQHL